MTVWLIADRTYLVTDPGALGELDAVIAERITGWGPLSEYKLTQALDLWVDRIDPGALRRTRNSARTRDFTVADADASGTAAVVGRLLGGDAALLKARVAAMARGVCEDDPRTGAQRHADALGALAAGSTVLSCRCENPHCAAVVDDGRASSIVVHVVAEQAATETAPDPQPRPSDGRSLRRCRMVLSACAFREGRRPSTSSPVLLNSLPKRSAPSPAPNTSRPPLSRSSVAARVVHGSDSASKSGTHSRAHSRRHGSVSILHLLVGVPASAVVMNAPDRRAEAIAHRFGICKSQAK